MLLTIVRTLSPQPVVLVVSFAVFSLFLALGNLSQLVAAVAILFLLYLVAGFAYLVNALPMLRRMRWFFLSIVIIYAWLTPGQPLLSDAPLVSWWMPSVEGVLMGGHRLLALVMMVLAVQWLLWRTNRGQLVSALYWLSTPLQFVGFSRDRLVVRVALVLGVLEQLQGYLGEQLKKIVLERGDLRGYATVAATLVDDVVRQGEQVPCHDVDVDVEAAPPLWQWLWPLVLTAVMLLVA